MITPQEKLACLLKSQHIPHAMLLAGLKETGKTKAAHQFALDLLQTTKKIDTHPDIHQFFPEGKSGMHPIETIRKLIHDVCLSPYESKWKIFIVHQADRMLPTSSNALLKTLEEPTGHTVIILISHHPEKLLPTIRSRCHCIEFSSTNKQEGSPALFEILESGMTQERLKNLDAEEGELVFETILKWYRDRTALEIGGCEKFLFFPEKAQQIQQTPLIPLEEVEKAISHVQLAYQRSTKLSLCVEMLLNQLNIKAQLRLLV